MADGIQATIVPVLDRGATQSAANQASQIWNNTRFSLGALETSKFTAPLGRIKGQLGEFEKSLDASNARVVAFGASAGAIFAVSAALKDTVRSAIAVEKSLTEIASIMGKSTDSMQEFGQRLFSVASEMGQTFDSASKGALELARQGLSAEETMKRLSAALLLTRQSGLSVEDSVTAITAAINSFTTQAIDASRLVQQLSAVDQKFAVGSADLAEALKRVGSTANDAGVSMEQLIALVTAAQQTTQRGGAVIGNAFKSIFTHLDRPKVLEQLEGVGVQVKNLDGSVRPLIGILGDLASNFDQLSHAQQANVAQLVGGVYQVNILRASLRDLSKDYSFYTQALSTANNATDEATRRNEQLNQSLSAQLNKAFNNFTKAGSDIGSQAFGPAIRKLLNTGSSDASGVGEGIGTAIFSGISKVLSGPAISGFTLIFLQLGKRLISFVSDALGQISGINDSRKNQIEIERNIVNWLQKEKLVLDEIKNGTLSAGEAHDYLVVKLKEETALMERIKTLGSSVAQTFNASGYKGGIEGLPLGIKIPTHIQNAAGGYAPDEVAEKYGALSGGYKPGAIKHAVLDGKKVTYNAAEKFIPYGKSAFIVPPAGSPARHEYNKKLYAKGIDPTSLASQGLIPNLALSPEDELKRRQILARAAKAHQEGNPLHPNSIIPAIRDKLISFDEAKRYVPQLVEGGAGKTQEKAAEERLKKFRKVDGRGYADMFVYEGQSGPDSFTFGKNKSDKEGNFPNGVHVDFNVAKLDRTKLKNPNSDLQEEVTANFKNSILQFANNIGIINQGFAEEYLNTAIKESASNIAATVGNVLEHGFVGAFGGEISRTKGEGAANFDVASVPSRLKEFFPESTTATIADFKTSVSPDTRKSFAYKILAHKAALKGVEPSDPERKRLGQGPSKEDALAHVIANYSPHPEGKYIDFFGGLVPNMAVQEKLHPSGENVNDRILYTENGSELNYIKRKNQYEIQNIISHKRGKGEGFELFHALLGKARATGGHIYSSSLTNQIVNTKGAKPEPELDNYSNLLKAFPQLRYRQVPGVNTKGDFHVTGIGEKNRSYFDSLEELSSHVNNIPKDVFQRAVSLDLVKVRGLTTASYGKIPNLNSAISNAKKREMAAGYRPDQVKVGYDSRIGPLVYNTTEGSAKNAVDIHRKMGKSISQIKKAGLSFNGKIPNLADDEGAGQDIGLGVGLFASQLAFSRAGSGLHQKEIQLNDRHIKQLEDQISADSLVTEKVKDVEAAQTRILTLKQQNQKLIQLQNNDEQRRSRLLGASFAAPLAGGIIESALQKSFPALAKSVGGLSDAFSVGAQVAFAIPGHIGLLIGALASVATGAGKVFHAFTDKAPELEQALNKEKDSFERISNSTSIFAQSFDKLNDAYQSQTTTSETIVKLQEEYATALANVPEEYRSLVSSAGSAADAQRAMAEALSKQATKIAQLELATSLTKKLDSSRGLFADTSVFNTKSQAGIEQIKTFASRAISTADKPQAFAARVAGSNINSAGDFKNLIASAKEAGEIGDDLSKTLERFGKEAQGLQGFFDNATESLNSFAKSLQDTAIATRDAVKNLELTSNIRKSQSVLDAKLKQDADNAKESIHALSDGIKALAGQGLSFANTRANLSNQGRANLGNTQVSALESVLSKFGGSLSDDIKGGLEDSLSTIKTSFEGASKFRSTNTDAINNIFASIQNVLEEIVNKTGANDEGDTKNAFKENQAIQALQDLGQVRGNVSSPEQASKAAFSFINKNNDLLGDKFEVLINKNDEIVRELVATKAQLDQDFKEQLKLVLINNQINEAARLAAERSKRFGGSEGFLNPASFKDALSKVTKGAFTLGNPNGEALKGRGAFDFLSGIKDIIGTDLSGPASRNLREVAVQGRAHEIQNTGNVLASTLEGQAFNANRGSVESAGLLEAAREIRRLSSGSEASATARTQIENAIPLKQMPSDIAKQVELLTAILGTLNGDITSALEDGAKSTRKIETFTPDAVAGEIQRKQAAVAKFEAKEKDSGTAQKIVSDTSSLINQVLTNHQGDAGLQNQLQNSFSKGDIVGSLKTVRENGDNAESSKATELLKKIADSAGGNARFSQLLGTAINYESKTAFAVTRLLSLGSTHGSIFTHDHSVEKAINDLSESIAKALGSNRQGGGNGGSGASVNNGNGSVNIQNTGGSALGKIAQGAGIAAAVVGGGALLATRPGRAAGAAAIRYATASAKNLFGRGSKPELSGLYAEEAGRQVNSPSLSNGIKSVGQFLSRFAPKLPLDKVLFPKNVSFAREFPAVSEAFKNSSAFINKGGEAIGKVSSAIGSRVQKVGAFASNFGGSVKESAYELARPGIDTVRNTARGVREVGSAFGESFSQGEGFSALSQYNTEAKAYEAANGGSLFQRIRQKIPKVHVKFGNKFSIERVVDNAPAYDAEARGGRGLTDTESEISASRASNGTQALDRARPLADGTYKVGVENNPYGGTRFGDVKNISEALKAPTTLQKLAANSPRLAKGAGTAASILAGGGAGYYVSSKFGNLADKFTKNTNNNNLAQAGGFGIDVAGGALGGAAGAATSNLVGAGLRTALGVGIRGVGIGAGALSGGLLTAAVHLVSKTHQLVKTNEQGGAALDQFLSGPLRNGKREAYSSGINTQLGDAAKNKALTEDQSKSLQDRLQRAEYARKAIQSYGEANAAQSGIDTENDTSKTQQFFDKISSPFSGNVKDRYQTTKNQQTQEGDINARKALGLSKEAFDKLSAPERQKKLLDISKAGSQSSTILEANRTINANSIQRDLDATKNANQRNPSKNVGGLGNKQQEAIEKTAGEYGISNEDEGKVVQKYGVSGHAVYEAKRRAAFITLAKKSSTEGLGNAGSPENELFKQLGNEYFEPGFDTNKYGNGKGGTDFKKLFTSDAGKKFNSSYSQSLGELGAKGLGNLGQNTPEIAKQFTNVGGYTYAGKPSPYEQRRNDYEAAQTQNFVNGKAIYADNSSNAQFLRGLNSNPLAKDAYLGNLPSSEEQAKSRLPPEVAYRQEQARYRQLGNNNATAPTQTQPPTGNQEVSELAQAVKDALSGDFATSIGKGIADSLKNNQGNTSSSNGQIEITWPKLEVSVDGTNITIKPDDKNNDIINIIVNQVLKAIGKPELVKPTKIDAGNTGN